MDEQHESHDLEDVRRMLGELPERITSMIAARDVRFPESNDPPQSLLPQGGNSMPNMEPVIGRLERAVASLEGMSEDRSSMRLQSKIYHQMTPQQLFGAMSAGDAINRAESVWSPPSSGHEGAPITPSPLPAGAPAAPPAVPPAAPAAPAGVAGAPPAGMPGIPFASARPQSLPAGLPMLYSSAAEKPSGGSSGMESDALVRVLGELKQSVDELRREMVTAAESKSATAEGPSGPGGGSPHAQGASGHQGFPEAAPRSFPSAAASARGGNQLPPWEVAKSRF